MISFLFCSGLLNFGLGLGCGIWLHRGRTAKTTENLPGSGADPQVAAPNADAKNNAASVPSMPAAATQAVPTEAQAPSGKTSDSVSHSWSAPKTWDDFGDQLQTLHGRILVARSANDLRLAKDIAAQLLACARYWSAPLKQELESLEQEAQASDEPAKYQVAIDKKELCLAQLETTIANLNAIDWDREATEILDQLDQEANLLDKNRRLVAPTKN